MKSHFAYHYTVLLCDTLIHYYLTITHFLQISLFPVGTVCPHSFGPSSLPALFPFQSLFQCLRYPPLRVSVSLSTLPQASSFAFLISFSYCFHYFQQVPCCVTPVAVVGNPGRDRSGVDS